ncbi:Uncharacterised protein g7903 [Pycnogonum litorale]
MEHPISRILTKYDVEQGTELGMIPYYTGMIDPVVMIALRCSDHVTVPGNGGTSSSAIEDDKLNRTRHEIIIDLEDRESNLNNDWLLHVQTARQKSEQNVELTSRNGRLYCFANKNIEAKSELLIWYGDDLLQMLGARQDVEDGDSYACQFCQMHFKYQNPYTAHTVFRCELRQSALIRNMSSSQIGSIPATGTTESHLKRNRTGQENREKESAPKRKSTAGEDVEVKKSCEDERRSELTIGSKHRSEDVDGSGDNCDNNNRVFSAFKKFENTTKTGGKLTNGSSSDDSRCRPIETRPDLINRDNISSRKRRLTVLTNNSRNYDSNPIESQSNPELFDDFSETLSLQSTRARENHRQSLVANTVTPDLVSRLSIMGNNKMILGLPDAPIIPTIPTPGMPALAPIIPIQNIGTILPAVAFPTENWCAKCNATFRMTSDLVYHMRTHHKQMDRCRKKRDEKLKCAICNESFRERHHLTRHMTSHL